MKSFNRRNRRTRQTRQQQQKDSSIFESHSSPLRDDSFFQAKLTVGQPGDQYEQEADAVAHQVMSGNGSKKNIMPVGKNVQSIPKEEKIYQDNMKADSEKKTDHVGEPMD